MFERVPRTAPKTDSTGLTPREFFIAEIQAWAASHDGQPPRHVDWHITKAQRRGIRYEEGWPSPIPLTNHFGSWAQALEAAGFDPRRPGAPSYDVHCVDCGAEAITRQPTTDTRCRRCAVFYGRHGMPWSEENADFRTWTEISVTNALHYWVECYGEPPSATDWNPAPSQHRHEITRPRFEEDGCWPYLNTVRTVFGTWNAAMHAAGLPVRMERMHCLTPAQRDEAARRYLDGEDAGVVAEEFGCTVSNVRQLAKVRS